MRLGSMLGAEIFEAGLHRGREYSVADLDTIAANFALAKGVVEPPLALGHEPEQSLTAALASDPSWTAAFSVPTFRHNSGSPAIGWIGNVRRSGRKLLADIRNIPGKIADLMDAKMLHKFSAELYPVPPSDAPAGCNGYMLKRVSLLGAHQPQLKTLADWHGLLFGEGDVTIQPWIIRQAVEAHQRESGAWEVFFECGKCGGDNVDRKALEKQLRDAGYSEAAIAALAGLPTEALPAFVAEALKVRPAPVAAPVIVPVAAVAPGITAEQFAEMGRQLKSAQDGLAAVAAQSQRQAADSAKLDKAGRAKLAETYCERWRDEGRIVPADFDKSAKVPTLYHELLTLDNTAVVKFSEGVEMTPFEAKVAQIEARPPGYVRRNFGEQIPQEQRGADAAVEADAKRYAESRNKKAG